LNQSLVHVQPFSHCHTNFLFAALQLCSEKD
jgi:hypothetical protein